MIKVMMHGQQSITHYDFTNIQCSNLMFVGRNGMSQIGTIIVQQGLIALFFSEKQIGYEPKKGGCLRCQFHPISPAIFDPARFHWQIWANLPWVNLPNLFPGTLLRMANFLDLPTELLLQIFKSLSTHDLAS